jgi:hypothetical protein
VPLERQKPLVERINFGIVRVYLDDIQEIFSILRELTDDVKSRALGLALLTFAWYGGRLRERFKRLQRTREAQGLGWPRSLRAAFSKAFLASCM